MSRRSAASVCRVCPRPRHRRGDTWSALSVACVRAEMATVGYTEAIKHDVYRMTGETGSYIYMAPEVVRSEQYNEKVCPPCPPRAAAAPARFSSRAYVHPAPVDLPHDTMNGPHSFPRPHQAALNSRRIHPATHGTCTGG